VKKQWRIPPNIKKIKDFRNWYKANMPRRSWCHACLQPSARDQGQVYLLCTPYGLITQKQEFIAWIYALTGCIGLAHFLATGKPNSNNRNVVKAKLRAKDLLLDHAEKKLDLRKGPWAYYNFYDWPGPYWPDERKILDYGDLWKPSSPLYQTILSPKPFVKKRRGAESSDAAR
jgi:hypothetical protein